MIEFASYTESQLYTVEQVQKVVENLSRTLNLNTTKVVFSENPSAVYLHVDDLDDIVEGWLTYDIAAQQPKIVINCDDLKKTWFHSVFANAILTAEERAGVVYVKQRVGFVTRLNTVLEFIENDHFVITYLMAGKGMTKKVYKVSDIIHQDQVLFELVCFKLFSDNMVATAESLQDLIDNFDKHVALIDMKAI